MTETEPQESGDNYRVESGSRVGSAFMVSVDTDRREDGPQFRVPGERNGNRE